MSFNNIKNVLSENEQFNTNLKRVNDMHKKTIRTITLLSFFSLYFFSILANAASFPRTEAEFSQLPPFCKARYSEGPSYKLWNKKLGRENFIHIHHLCSGLNGINASFNINKQHPGYARTLRSAISGIDYVLQRTDKSFVLYPGMLLKKGEALLLLNKPGEAITEIQEAISINPKYSPAYAKLSDIYKAQGDKVKAKKILEQGLKFNPKSKSLRRKLNKT